MNDEYSDINIEITGKKDISDPLDKPNYYRGVHTDDPCPDCEEAADRLIEGSSTANTLICFADDNFYRCGYCGWTDRKEEDDEW